MIKAILSITLFFFVNQLNAQKLQNGLILPKNYDTEGLCCIYVPSDGFKIYDSPSGQNIGVLTKNVRINTGDQSPYRIYLDLNKAEPDQIELKHFQQTGYEVWAVTYFERSSGFIRIINEQGNYWLDENEIITKNFKIQEWHNFLLDNVGKLLGFYAFDSGLNLRTEPSTESEVLKTLRGDLFEITPTNDQIGIWIKVKVKKYKEHPCSSLLSNEEILEYEINGWVKILDDSGKPNVWYYPRGC